MKGLKFFAFLFLVEYAYNANKRAMLRSLGGGQIKKQNKNGSGQSQSCTNNNKIIIKSKIM